MKSEGFGGFELCDDPGVGAEGRTDRQGRRKFFEVFSNFRLILLVFSRMRSEGFLFLSGGSGGGTVFVPISGLWPRTTAQDRARSRAFVLCPMRCALRIRLEGGRLGEALWRRAVVIGGVVIGGESLVWDCWGEPGLGGAVPL